MPEILSILLFEIIIVMAEEPPNYQKSSHHISTMESSIAPNLANKSVPISLQKLIHMSYLRLKLAPSIFWHQIQSNSLINDEEHIRKEAEELQKLAYKYYVHTNTVNAFFRGQNEGGLLIRYSLLGTNMSEEDCKVNDKIFKPEQFKLKLESIHDILVENLSAAEDVLISGNCRTDLYEAINNEVVRHNLTELYATALMRSMAYMIDVCQLHSTWITGEPPWRKIILPNVVKEYQ